MAGNEGRGDAYFVGSAVEPKQFPTFAWPTVAFAGRSNVGKSSLINRLIGKRGLARSSKQPGRTQTLNFFAVGGRWLFVDLPGYGFAKVSQRMRAHWRLMVEGFIQGCRTLRLVVVVVDARHPAMELDRRMVAWLGQLGIPFRVVATKVDKVPRSRRAVVFAALSEGLNVDRLVPFSATTGEGNRELWQVIRDHLET